MQKAYSFKFKKSNKKRREKILKHNIFILLQNAFSCRP